MEGFEGCPWCGDEPRISTWAADVAEAECANPACPAHGVVMQASGLLELEQLWNTRRAEKTRRTPMGLCGSCGFVLQPMYAYCPKCGREVERSGR